MGNPLVGWIRLRVLNQRFEFESEIDVLASEVCLLQAYAEKPDVVHPGILEATPPIPPQVEKGYPAFTAVSVKSGLQFRVEDSKDSIIDRL